MSLVDTNVPKEYVRAIDPQLLPPRAGHNWNDQAFRKNQDKPQQLEGEFRGKRAFVASDTHHANPLPENLGLAARQLLTALSSTRHGRTSADSGSADLRYVTLDDKVLRFYGFFSEPAPEGGVNEYWHRQVVIFFYPSDESILVQEPRITNSGRDGGVFLKRQRVKADARQRERYPDDEYVTLNWFNVGQTVRLNAHEFFLYDCDSFTREFLTALGVNVGEAVPCPAEDFMSDAARYRAKIQSGSFGLLSQGSRGDEAARAARFVQDGGKTLRFYGLLDERDRVEHGMVRRLEVLLRVEDSSISIVERPTTAEASPALFLSRCWLPRSGSVSRLNELTFMHRVNGQRQPDVGPEGYYVDTDLDVGVTINVLGRPVLLYDCDDFTREFYRQRHNIHLREPVNVDAYFRKTNTCTTRAAIADGDHDNQPRAPVPNSEGGHHTADVLRFFMTLASPRNVAEQHRRFTLAFFTDTQEVTVYESAAVPNNGYAEGCFLKRQRLRRPSPPCGPRNAPPTQRETRRQGGEYYEEADFRVGKQVVVSGLVMNITNMDTHTATYLAGHTPPPPTSEYVSHLLCELLEYLGSRYGTAVKAFLAFDHDRDGVISIDEFTKALQQFQITDSTSLARRLFDNIAPAPHSAFLTTDDFMKWMGSQATTVQPVTQAAPSLDDQNGMAEAQVCAQQQQALADCALYKKALGKLRERLEARCLSSVQMFRLASTMPRAYRLRRADVHTLSNPHRDAVITPVQLRRCIEEVLGGNFDEAELHCILSFFYPALSPTAHTRVQDDSTEGGVDLGTFQEKYCEMWQLTMLPEKVSKRTDAVVSDRPAPQPA